MVSRTLHKMLVHTVWKLFSFFHILHCIQIFLDWCFGEEEMSVQFFCFKHCVLPSTDKRFYWLSKC